MGEKTKKSCAVNFVGWKQPLRDWEPWILKLSSAHHSTWKKAGIYEAIMCSKYTIRRHQELIFELASRWRSQTNTFVFPWGEATLTLEDMLVLGGFSSYGLSALTSLEGDAELLKIESQLEQGRKEMNRSKSKKALQGKWMEKFVDCGGDLEHVAFLALWLSRFVCPMGTGDIVNNFSFPIAIRLSRGVRIAIAPAVLATLYKELTALSERLKGENFERLDLLAPFQLLQIWAWERFPTLKPASNNLNSGRDFPRVARWSCVNISKDKDLVFALDCAGKSFVWCPYGAIDKLGGDLDLFPWFRETSEVVGFDSCIEKYSPRRVARQFGLDQDFPDDDHLKDAGSGRGYAKSSQIELVVIQDSDSSEDYDDEDDKLTINQLLKRAAGSKGSPPSSNACPDVKHAVMGESVREDEKTGCGKKTDDLNVTAPRELESFASSIGTTEEMIFMNTSEDDKVDAECRNTGFFDAGGSVLENEFGMSYQHAREESSLDFDLEARISWLEKVVEGIKSRMAVPRQE